MVVLMTLAIGAAAVTAEPVAQWGSYYCTSGNCGINYYNYNYGFNTGYYCSANYKLPYQAAFVKDVTIPDGSYVAPGKTFTKTWRIRNVGTSTWTTSMALVYYSGDQMGGPNCVYLPWAVGPGAYVDISVKLTAPDFPTSTIGQWMLRAPNGTLFGVGCNGATPVWVSINTMQANSGCACYSPTGCNTPCTPVAAADNTTTRPGRNPYCNNKIRSVNDVTIPDGTVVAPGATFRKTWSMKNGGTCTWDENYVLTWVAGADLGGPKTVSVTSASNPNVPFNVSRPATKIYPGNTTTISIDLVAPTTPGKYTAFYRLRDNLGYEFGYGSYADEAFWVSIVVDGSAAKSADEEEIVITKDAETGEEIIVLDDPALEVAEAEVVEQPSAETAAAETAANKCGEQSIAMRATDTGYQVLWTAANAGSKTWENYSLVKSDSNPAVKLASDKIPVPVTEPGGAAEVSFNIDIDQTVETSDPYWMEFYMDSGEEGFCEFYFEAPAK